MSKMSYIPLNKKNLDEFVKTMFIFVRERARLSDRNASFPSHVELMGVTIEA